MMRYLRNIVDGTIYEWDPILAENAKCEPISEEAAFPERFLDKVVVEKVTKARKKRGATLDLGTEEIPEEPEAKANELGVEASKGMPA